MYERGEMMDAFNHEVKRLCDSYTKEQLAEQIITNRALIKSYRETNDELRKEAESLAYLISRQRQKLDNQ